MRLPLLSYAQIGVYFVDKVSWLSDGRGVDTEYSCALTPRTRKKSYSVDVPPPYTRFQMSKADSPSFPSVPSFPASPLSPTTCTGATAGVASGSDTVHVSMPPEMLGT